jgi:hypothetical protein
MLEKGVSDLKTTNTRHDEQITTLNNTLKKIDENTTWIKRTIIALLKNPDLPERDPENIDYQS